MSDVKLEKIYTQEEVLEECNNFFNGDDLAASVVTNKYLLRNKKNQLLEKNPNDKHRRLAKEFARIESHYKNPLSEDQIFSVLEHYREIVAQGSPMSAIGNPYHIQSSGNCFVTDSPTDSYSGIFYADQQLAQLMKRRCGAGMDISTIRPKGLPVNNAAKTTDGLGVFMERFSNTCREVAQGGRRGALLLSLHVKHPDIFTFINIKNDKTKVTGANVSVRLTDEFMKAVKNDEDFELKFPVDSDNPLYKTTIKAKDLWKEIIHNAWANAEPGIMFWDTMEKYTPSNVYGAVDPAFKNKTTNPCGEIIMGTDSCRLMLMNAYSFVDDPFTENAIFNFERFAEKAKIAQRLMDDLVDIEIELMKNIIFKIESDPEPEHIKKIELDMWTEYLRICKTGRRTGLGLTGIGDTLAALNIRYGSKESIKKVEEIYKSLCLNAYKESCILAKERGKFEIYDYELEKNNPFMRRIFDADPEIEELHKKYGRRNVGLLTTAPAGSVSTLTQTTSGIEPVFALDYLCRKKINPMEEGIKVDFVDKLGDKWQEYKVYHHKFKDWMRITGKTAVEDSPYYKATANEIDWVASVELQAAAQKWICHSISKTCNVPKNTTEEEVAKIYMTAWESGCKGLTIYRDDCRDGVLIRDGEKESIVLNSRNSDKIIKHDAPKRPEVLPAEVHFPTYKRQKYYVAVGLLNGDPYEIFSGINHNEDGSIMIPDSIKNGHIIKKARGNYVLSSFDKNNIESAYSVTDAQDESMEALHRIISANLRHGTDISYIVHQLEKTRGPLSSFTKVLARILKKYIVDGTKVSGEVCPSCSSESLCRSDGCVKCVQCGWTKCA